MTIVPIPGESLESDIRRAGRIAESIGLGAPDEAWIKMVLGRDEPKRDDEPSD